MTHLFAAGLALPWILVPFVTLLRARRSRSLDEYSASPLDHPPTLSIVIPARNEARNIERCVRSALRADYPGLDVVVVDDHSTDGTGRILRGIAESDARLRVVVPPPLPSGWFGKQWACAAGAAATSSDIIGFLDADTRQAPDLVPRVVRAMQSRRADLLSVGGTQELGSFWERVLQPQVFGVILIRYGGTEAVNNSRNAADKIANGQCLFVRRDAYDALGGHGAVRDKVAEDLAIAQLYFAAGRSTVLVLGLNQLSTRMYTSLHEIAEGWGKNIYAGGQYAMPLGLPRRVLYPVALVLPALAELVPPVLLALALCGVLETDALVWSATAAGATLMWWLLVYWWLDLSLVFALLYPLGALVLLNIAIGSIARGKRVVWKGREYIAN